MTVDRKNILYTFKPFYLSPSTLLITYNSKLITLFLTFTGINQLLTIPAFLQRNLDLLNHR